MEFFCSVVNKYSDGSCFREYLFVIFLLKFQYQKHQSNVSYTYKQSWNECPLNFVPMSRFFETKTHFNIWSLHWTQRHTAADAATCCGVRKHTQTKIKWMNLPENSSATIHTHTYSRAVFRLFDVDAVNLPGCLIWVWVTQTPEGSALEWHSLDCTRVCCSRCLPDEYKACCWW